MQSRPVRSQDPLALTDELDRLHKGVSDWTLDLIADPRTQEEILSRCMLLKVFNLQFAYFEHACACVGF